MTVDQHIDLKNNLFKHPELNRVTGEQTTATPVTIQAKIRDNAQSAPSYLGNRGNGPLALVCTPISGTFTRSPTIQ